ncbi:hypothetical protein [Chryseobacterium sp. GP-SGM7]|uniref:hypothetical protein n=1 Tax=Chryseobacterium sp. GP-SGM7 TaxID=3411323 RepID=UPI003B947DBD
MGIVALVSIVIIVLIFFILKIPRLTIRKKILIIVSVLLLCIITLAVIFIIGFDRGKISKREEVEYVARNSDTKKKADSSIIKISEDKMASPNNSEKNKAILFKIEGIYEVKKEKDCRMSLILYYQKNQLKYKLKTETHEFSDNAEIELNEKKDGYYITFKNIEWSEYLGGLDNEGEPIDKNLELPNSVSGSLYKDQITIQNYGNSMNYYVVFDDCGEKYIELIKK